MVASMEPRSLERGEKKGQAEYLREAVLLQWSRAR